MAGLYIHIPFCEKRCLYCDFFSQTDSSSKEAFLQALLREMELRSDYLKGEELETVYLGGGTPSQLLPGELERIFRQIDRLYKVSATAEITLEANPDDLTPAYIQSLRKLPVNRISMGIQSFNDTDLTFLNRRHTARQAVEAVEQCRSAGFDNLSIDLIYGLPGQTPEAWESNLAQALRLDIPHLSAYHLIYEEGTPLYRQWQAGKVRAVGEETSLRLFTLLIDRMKENGYLHYEISNFCRPDAYSRHNSSYWTGKPYLGLGPSAHSYNGESRQWNVSSLPDYIRSVGAGEPKIEIERLDDRMKYNDYIITGLRTQWGIDLKVIGERFGAGQSTYCIEQARPYLSNGTLKKTGEILQLSPQGIFISDGIMSDLLWV